MFNEITPTSLPTNGPEDAPTQELGGPANAFQTETTLAVLTRRLGLSFWGHESVQGDFIVLCQEPLEVLGDSL